ncbi:DUF4190 domain-containing protein [Kitasatospora cineracea]|uniref:Uncharacterized protein DUF4190 n=1 Tax=Kitasatospora cineracea TaxID=88074 RepID=A0A3N4RFE9_9ACTN|nr:DUF4190 domain-containing protein [Kitasatospora cineracea]RPE32062.1 uncharacterized protein DUF4190 [Kitasatospora cineracea]
MPLDQEGTGKDGPDAPPALSLEKRGTPAVPTGPAEPADSVADVEQPAPAVSFAKPAADADADAGTDAGVDTGTDAGVDAEPAGPVADAAPAPVPAPAPAPTAVEPAVPANPWAPPAPGAPVPAAAAASAANPWAPPAPGAPVPAPGPVPGPAAAGGAAVGNPWAPAPGGQQPWGSGALPPGAFPPGAVPYGMPGHPVFPQRQLYTNGLAIASLVVSFLCFVGAAGIVMGAIALRQIKRTGERGRGLAIAGIVIGSLWLAVFVAGVVGNAFSVDTGEDGSSGFTSSRYGGSPVLPAASPLRLEVGECFDLAGTLVARKVDCSKPHKGEVFWTGIPVETGDYPLPSVLEAEAKKGCKDHVDQYVMDTWTLGDSLDYRYLYPDRNSWDAVSGRRLVCFFTGSGQLTGSLRKDQTNLTYDQLHLLLATDQFDRAWSEGPGTDLDVQDDPAGFRTWAGQLAAAADRQAATLSGARWTTADRATVDRLVAESKVAAQHFRAAANAPDDATTERELTAGYKHLGDDLILDLRRQLGLTTQDEESGKHPSNQAV